MLIVEFLRDRLFVQLPFVAVVIALLLRNFKTVCSFRTGCNASSFRSGRSLLAEQFACSSLGQALIHTSTAFSSERSKSKHGGSAAQYARRMLKDYKLPEIRTEDCEQSYISGSGPGGQNVNKSQNAAQIRHKPTNIVVKVHESRLLQDNVKLAFQRLRLAVDHHLNGDRCYEAEFERLQRKYENKLNRAREKRRQIKELMANSDDKESNA